MMNKNLKITTCGLPLLLIQLLGMAQSSFTVTGPIGNFGAIGYGVGTGTKAFIITSSGSYTAASTATANFYDATGSGTPIEIAGVVAPTFFNLMLANGTISAVSISNTAGVNVSNLLTFNSGIVTNRTVGAAGAISFLTGNTGYTGTPSTIRFVDGYVKQANTSTFTYPVGANGVYSPITFSNPNGSNVQYNQSTPPNPTTLATQGGGLQLTSVSSKEFYNLVTSGSNSGDKVTIPYNNFGPSGYVGDPNTLTIAGYNGTQWVNLGTSTANTSTKTVTTTLNIAMSSFTAVSLASTSISNALPVTLTSFTAAVANCDGLLKWNISAELNTDKYVVERSTDGSSFSATGEIKAKNTSTPTTYTYLYAGLGKGTNYFRLKMVEMDGPFTYSNTVLLVGTCGGQTVVSPNPLKGTLYVHGLQKGSSVEVYNNLGQQMAKLAPVAFDDDSRAIDVSRYTSGDYIVRIILDNKIVSTSKVVKL